MGFRILGGGSGGGAPAAINFRKDIETGIAMQSRLIAKQPQSVGFAVEQAPATLNRLQEAGVAVETFASGTSNNAQAVGFAQGSVLTMNNLPEGIAGFGQQQTIDYVGSKFIATATNIGSENWTNVTNAQGENDGANATRAGQVLNATDAQIRGQMDSVGTKDPLNIDRVELRYYVSQTGTALNNGGLELDYRIGSSGAWTNLATYTNDQNFLTTPDAYDITSAITGWNDIRAIEIRVRCNLAIATSTVTCNCDAVLLHLEASLIE